MSAPAEVLEGVSAGLREEALPTVCGDGSEALPPGASLTSTRSGTLVADFVEEDQRLGISQAGSKEYSCSCTGEGGGTCYPKLVGSDVVCISTSCNQCKLSATAVSRFTAMERLSTACGEQGEVEREVVAARAAQVRQWQARNRHPEPLWSRDRADAIAPEGYGLVVEQLGGARIVYTAPAAAFDEVSGELLRAVGPPHEGDALLLQAAGGGRAKCFCSGTGDCSFTLDNVCAGTCTGDRGCVIRIRGVRSAEGDPIRIDLEDPYRGQ